MSSELSTVFKARFAKFVAQSEIQHFLIDNGVINATEQRGLNTITLDQDYSASIFCTQGIGDEIKPFQLSSSDFEDWISGHSFPKSLLRNFWRPRSNLFEYDFVGNDKVFVVFSWYFYNTDYLTVFCRYDFKTKRLHVLCSSEGIPCLRKALEDALGERSCAEEFKNIFPLLGPFLTICSLNTIRIADTMIRPLNQAEREFETSPDIPLLSFLGYQRRGMDLQEIYASLFKTQKDLARIISRCEYLKLVVSAFASFEKQVSLRNGACKTDLCTEQNREKLLTDITRRMDSIIAFKNSQQKRLASLSDELSYRMLQADSRLTLQINSSMRTVAILGLAYMPAQLVSAIFATPVFDFQNWRKDGKQDMSQGSIAYAMACILLTAITLSAWLFVNWRDRTRWGRKNTNLVS